MKAAFLQAPRQIAISSVARPKIGREDVLVRVRSVGVCASDVHYYEHGRIGRYIVDAPLILGHESAGEVVEIGPAVTHLSEGDRVTLEPGIPCKSCAYCLAGRYNLCESVCFMATPPVHGSFVEYVSHPADFCFKIPDSMSFDEAALMEPLSVGLFAVERSNVRIGDNVAIIGAGPIGLVTLLVLKAQGINDVTVFDAVESRVESAEHLGACAAFNVHQCDLARDFDSAFDAVFETAGSAEATSLTTRLVSRGGSITLVGLVAETTIPFNSNEIVDKGVDVKGVFRYANTYPRAIQLVSSGLVDVSPLVSRHFSLDETADALEFALTAKDQCIKAIVKP